MKEAPIYSGGDMAGFMLMRGFQALDGFGGIVSITNVADQAVIVTGRAIFVAKPAHLTGFMVELVAYL